MPGFGEPFVYIWKQRGHPMCLWASRVFRLKRLFCRALALQSKQEWLVRKELRRACRGQVTPLFSVRAFGDGSVSVDVGGRLFTLPSDLVSGCSNLKASPMPPAPLHAVCSEAAIAPSTIWYRVCTKHGTSLASFLAAGEDRTILPQHTIYKTTE